MPSPIRFPTTRPSSLSPTIARLCRPNQHQHSLSFVHRQVPLIYLSLPNRQANIVAIISLENSELRQEVLPSLFLVTTTLNPQAIFSVSAALSLQDRLPSEDQSPLFVYGVSVGVSCLAIGHEHAPWTLISGPRVTKNKDQHLSAAGSSLSSLALE